MALARTVGKSPMEIAQQMVTLLNEYIVENPNIEKIEIAAPGYINFFLSQAYFHGVVRDILEQGATFGDVALGAGIQVNNEFISANPTGPLHLGNGRGGFFGDSLTRVLRKAGYAVTSEYYVNDAGEQVMKLGHSVLKDTEAVYGGEYIDVLAEKFGREATSDVRTVGRQSAAYVLQEYIQKTIQEKMQIVFDVWMSEADLYGQGYVERAIEVLKTRELTFEQDGALWFRSTSFGDDKDRVLVKQDGSKTYFASDCGYILSKMERGFTLCIETWGADHHGYINRFKAAAQALGLEQTPRFVIVQLVRVVKDGQEVRMSKRAGNVIAVDDLIDRVGHDVARFFFLMYSPDTHMNFDLGLAEERSQKNPVYYVQYAHARIASLLQKATEEGVVLDEAVSLDVLTHEKEISLIRELSRFPMLIESIARDFSVHLLPHYAISLADTLHAFYDACRVIDAEDIERTQARLALVRSAQRVLAETLRLIGVSAPDRM
jgi:arginyl-tRNA synthetase